MSINSFENPSIKEFAEAEEPLFDSRGPRPKSVNQFHFNDDVDSGVNSHHHTLGIKATQAAPGDHRHDGISSKSLLSGTTLTDLNSVILALVKLGAVDGR